MNILFASKTTAAGTKYSTPHIINKYSDKLNCKVLGQGKCGGMFDHIPEVSAIHDTRQAVEWADVVHCYHTTSAADLHVPDLIDKRRWVYQWIGCLSYDRDFNRLWPGEHRQKVNLAHIGQGQDRHPFFRQFKDRTTLLPNLVDIDNPLYAEVPYSKKEKEIGFYPAISSRLWPEKDTPSNIRRVVNKCQRETLKLLDDYNVDTHHANEPFSVVMDKKGACFLGVDQLIEQNPHWNLTWFEFMAKGTPCFIYLDEYSRQQFQQMVGALPPEKLVLHTPEDIRERIAYMINETPEWKAAFYKQAREWMEKWYHPHRLVKQYEEFYYGL